MHFVLSLPRASQFPASLLLGFALAACGEHRGAREFELSTVIEPAIVELQHTISGREPVSAPALGSEDTDRLRRLVRQTSSAEDKLPADLSADLHALGDGAIPMLATVLADPTIPALQRVAALQLLGAVDTPLAAEHVLSTLLNAQEPALRRAALRALPADQDQVVPSLLARFQHELDEETLIAIGSVLASFGNYSAVDRMAKLAESASNTYVRDDARAALRSIRVPTIGDPISVARLWKQDDPERRFPEFPVSARHRLEVWKRIHDLAADDRERAQDARLVLTNEAAWTAELLVQALHERDVKTRIEAARCLAGMGPRALHAGPALMTALADPPLAPDAALALGDIGFATAVPELMRRLENDHPRALRVAAARALGRLHLAQAIAPLRACLASDQPLELRQAAAHSLVVLGSGDEVATFLVECMTSPAADSDAAERALEYWLEHPESPSSQASSLLQRWRSLAGPPGIELDDASLKTRREARAAIVGTAGSR